MQVLRRLSRGRPVAAGVSVHSHFRVAFSHEEAQKIADVGGELSPCIPLPQLLPDASRPHVEATIRLVPLLLHEIGGQIADFVTRLFIVNGEIAPVIAEKGTRLTARCRTVRCPGMGQQS